MANAVTVPEQEFANGMIRLLSMKDVDCRKGPTRRLLARARRIANDLGGDLTEAQRQLVQRTVVLGVLLEHNEAKLLLGEHVSVGDYLEMINVQRRLLCSLGLKRQLRDIMLDPLDYAKEHSP